MAEIGHRMSDIAGGALGIRAPISDPRSPPAEPAVRLAAVVKRFGRVEAVGGVSLDVPGGALVALVGPSGCGKTTLLRLVGGFETPDAGTVWLGGRDVTRTPPQGRPTATVFQSYALFPTMTVGENVGYGLAVRKEKPAAVREKVARALARVDLKGLEDRPVGALSGGQQQRVALARALAVEPAVLLFDEPLSNLDPALREATRAEVKSPQRELGTAALWVTHDQSEALALADHLAVMRAGRVVGEGTPESLFFEPASGFVAQFLGGANVVESAALAARLAREPVPTGRALAIRPEWLEPLDGPAEAATPARLVSRLFQGTHAEWTVEVEGPTRLRLWTEPERPAPDALFVRAARWRWVAEDASVPRHRR